MFLNDKQREEFREAAKPLVKWLNENSNPHATVMVNTNSAELTEGLHLAQITEYTK